MGVRKSGRYFRLEVLMEQERSVEMWGSRGSRGGEIIGGS